MKMALRAIVVAFAERGEMYSGRFNQWPFLVQNQGNEVFRWRKRSLRQRVINSMALASREPAIWRSECW